MKFKEIKHIIRNEWLTIYETFTGYNVLREENNQLLYPDEPSKWDDHEVWSWKKPYTISIYENEYFYYQKDPDKCIQYVTKNLKEKRLATEQETYEHDLHLKYLAIAIVILIVLFVGVIIGSFVYYKIKEREVKDNGSNNR